MGYLRGGGGGGDEEERKRNLEGGRAAEFSYSRRRAPHSESCIIGFTFLPPSAFAHFPIGQLANASHCATELWI